MEPLESEKLLSRLPHQPPMRIIEAVVDGAENWARCRFNANHRLCELFGDGKSLHSHIGIEAIAQTAAIAIARGDPQRAPKAGMLMQIGSFECFERSVPSGSTLVCHASAEIASSGQAALVSGTLHYNEHAICKAKLSLTFNDYPASET